MEYFHCHRASICWIDNNPDLTGVVSLDQKGILCHWEYSVAHRSGYGWISPQSTTSCVSSLPSLPLCLSRSPFWPSLQCFPPAVRRLVSRTIAKQQHMHTHSCKCKGTSENMDSHMHTSTQSRTQNHSSTHTHAHAQIQRQTRSNTHTHTHIKHARTQLNRKQTLSLNLF